MPKEFRAKYQIWLSIDAICDACGTNSNVKNQISICIFHIASILNIRIDLKCPVKLRFEIK